MFTFSAYQCTNGIMEILDHVNVKKLTFHYLFAYLSTVLCLTKVHTNVQKCCQKEPGYVLILVIHTQYVYIKYKIINVADQFIQQENSIPRQLLFSFQLMQDLPSMYLQGGSIIPVGCPIQHVGEANPTDELSLFIALDEHGSLLSVNSFIPYSWTRNLWLIELRYF